MKITVTDEFTEITDGTETTDTVIRFGTSGPRMVIGDGSGRSFLDAMPLADGQVIVVPAGVSTSAIMSAGKVGVVWKETGFSV
jgi:hypothetical protein